MQTKQRPSILQTKFLNEGPLFGWKEIPGVPRYYKQTERKIIKLVENGELEIDDKGQIWRVKIRKGLRNGGVKTYRIKIRRAENITQSGYFQIRSMINSNRYCAQASRLVWHYFFGPIPFGKMINHKNGKKTDNTPNNLEVVTAVENMQHAIKNNLRDQWGQKNPVAKLTDNDIYQIRKIYSFENITKSELSRVYGVSSTHIGRIVNGLSRKKQLGATCNNNKFKIGDLVTWVSMSRGYLKYHSGNIFSIVPSGISPLEYGYKPRGGTVGSLRNNESYIIQIGKRTFWPKTDSLKRPI